MISNNPSLEKIQQLTKKLRTIDKRQKIDHYQLQLERQVKRWKDAIMKHDKIIGQNADQVNRIIQMRHENDQKIQSIGMIREVVVSELQKMEEAKRLLFNKSKQRKTVQSEGQYEPFRVQEISLNQFEDFSNKLSIVSMQTSKINGYLVKTINDEFDRLEFKIQQQYSQQKSRNSQLVDCICALEDEFSLSVQFQQRQFVTQFQELHYSLQKVIESVTAQMQFQQI